MASGPVQEESGSQCTYAAALGRAAFDEQSPEGARDGAERVADKTAGPPLCSAHGAGEATHTVACLSRPLTVPTRKNPMAAATAPTPSQTAPEPQVGGDAATFASWIRDEAHVDYSRPRLFAGIRSKIVGWHVLVAGAALLTMGVVIAIASGFGVDTTPKLAGTVVGTEVVGYKSGPQMRNECALVVEYPYGERTRTAHTAYSAERCDTETGGIVNMLTLDVAWVEGGHALPIVADPSVEEPRRSGVPIGGVIAALGVLALLIGGARYRRELSGALVDAEDAATERRSETGRAG